MALNKQMYIYSVDTSCFYNEYELRLHRKLNLLYFNKNKNKKALNKIEKQEVKEHEDLQLIEKKIERHQQNIRTCNTFIKQHKGSLKENLCLLKSNTNVRELNTEMVGVRNVISIFDSALTRTMGLEEKVLSEELIIVQTYFYDMLEDIINNGFTFKGEKYICYTASAGQIRTKKTVFIKESSYAKYEKTITCGLTIDKINEKGGSNINKYLAYLALANSATDVWTEFDIRKSIVVDDFETLINAEVDFINDEYYSIKRQFMDIPIPHTDGVGIMLEGKNKMVRLPWVKGLMVMCPYDIFIKENNCRGVIKDIYGKEYNILKDDIQYIFTKSQFKMWKYYESWGEYIENYEKYNCTAGKCNEEEDEFKKAKINYQMLQTLTDMTDNELSILSKQSREDIQKMTSDIDTIYKILGVTKYNKNKNYLQKSIEIYPELLRDVYSKELLKQLKKSLVKSGRSGKLAIDATYTFLIPDLYAFCEWLFLGIENPKGILKNGEVSCSIYDNEDELDCLRSPHLYREHAVRKNVVNGNISKWFVTKGIYTSVHDPISKILQFDVDGDRSLVCKEKTLVDVAKRNTVGIVPLYYNMRKASNVMINKKEIYNGLKLAYTGGNIGIYSNDISKIWNSGNINLDAIKLLCMENNFVIDYAKTLYKPERPKTINKIITGYTKAKTPHFFIYAKDKGKDKVEPMNNSLVNRITSKNYIPNPRLKFTNMGVGEFDYKNLVSANVGLKRPDAKAIIKKYEELDINKRHMIKDTSADGNKPNEELFAYEHIRKTILDVNNDINFVVNVLVKYLYQQKKSNYKIALWSSFGDVIYENINNNVVESPNFGKCKECGILIRLKNNKQIYCENCKIEKDREKYRKYNEKRRK